MHKNLNLLYSLTIQELVDEVTSNISVSQNKLIPDLPSYSDKQFQLGQYINGVKHFSAKRSQTPIVSFDSTCVTALHSKNYLILAARAVAVNKDKSLSKQYHRWGPLFFSRIQQNIGIDQSNIDGKYGSIWIEEFIQSQVRLSLELCLLKRAFNTSDNSIILFDGSPNSNFTDYSLSSHLNHISNQPIAIVGISKTSTSEYFGSPFEFLEMSSKTPSYVEIKYNSSSKSYSNWVTFAVKFSNSGLPLRVDILPLKISDPIQILEILAGSDSFYSGYPESLRLAHHLSVFTPLESSGLKNLIETKTNHRNLSYRNRRLTFLGSIN